jgi:microcystin degradation protein MlrC
MPSGVIERATCERLRDRIRAVAHDVDGICLYLYGEMRAEGYDYGDNEILQPVA